MTLFAGAYSLKATASVPPALRSQLEQNLRTCPDERGRHWKVDTPGCFIVGWDSGAFEPAFLHDAEGNSTALAGDPLLCEAGTRPQREEQARRLHAALSSGEPRAALLACRGSFALVDYSAPRHALVLATDAVGLRSVYYTVQDGMLVFATALRVLEAMSTLRRSLDAQGMAELGAFSFPLADRTPYQEIKVLRESEMLLAHDEIWALENYGDWGDNRMAKPNEANTAQLYQVFRDAIALRLDRDQRAYSFLSGGMDSRSIVATLLADGCQIEALNFSVTESQDQSYAQQFASQVPHALNLHCLAGGIYPNFSFLALAAKTHLEAARPTGVDRPQFIWSGDGGSVGLGHVYMDEQVVELAERSGVAAAARHFLTFNRVALPVGILDTDARGQLPERLLQAVISEMQRYPCTDSGRQVYFFLLFNDQRRHLFKHFETIDQHGLELLTPFYDTAFLKAIAATPSREGILHRLYARWFEHLPAFARLTAWQTYPGHVPCPIPTPSVGIYQWGPDHYAPRTDWRARLGVASELLAVGHALAPLQTFSRLRLWMAAGLHATGLRDCSHVLAVLRTYRQHALQLN